MIKQTPNRPIPSSQSSWERSVYRAEASAKSSVERPRFLFSYYPNIRTLIFRAPRGYGKSIALAQNFRAFHISAAPVVWLSLGLGLSTEGEIAAAAANQINASRDERSHSDGNASIELSRPGTLTALSAELWNQPSCDSTRILICLDNIEAEEAPLRELEAFVLDTPPNVHFAIAGSTRRGFARLGLEANVRQFSARDLAFTHHEAAELLRVRAQHDATSVNTEAIIAQTGGWPALSVIMCATEQAESPVASWPEAKAFFEEEVLSGITAAEQELLNKAAMITPFCAESYDYIFRTEDGASLISRFRDDFLLLTPSNGRMGQVSFQPALDRYLQDRFLAKNSQAAAHIFKRGAFWHWRRREFYQAIVFALKAGDHRWAMSLSDDIILDLVFRQGEIEVLLDWLQRAPLQQLRRRPVICLGAAWTLYLSQRASEAERILSYVSDTSALETPKREQGWGQLVRAIGKTTQDLMRESEALCIAWMEEFGSANVMGRGLILTCLAFIHSSEYRFDELKVVLARAHAVNDVAHQRHASAWLHAAEILAALGQGNIYNAKSLIEEARKRNAIHATRNIFSSKLVDALELEVLYELGQLTPTEQQLEHHLDFISNFGITDIFHRVCRVAATVRANAGDTKAASHLLEWACTLAGERSLPRLNTLCQLELAELKMTFGGSGILSSINPSGFDEVYLGTHSKPLNASLLLVKSLEAARKGQVNLMKHNAESAERTARSIGAGSIECRALLYQAAANGGAGAWGVARRKAMKAKILIERLGCIETARRSMQVLGDLLPATSEILSELNLASIIRHPDFGAPEIPAMSNSRTVALTERQVVVLKLIRDGLSNKQIAAQLSVTEDNVKWHVRKIFSCLCVRNRAHAVSEATRRKLI